MKTIKNKIFITIVMVSFFVALPSLYLQAAALKKEHADLSCADCHTEKTVLPNTAVCLSCHGSYGELAKATEHTYNIQKAVPVQNVHDSHIGEAECTLCHKEHFPSVLYCNKCHLPEIDLKTP